MAAEKTLLAKCLPNSGAAGALDEEGGGGLGHTQLLKTPQAIQGQLLA